MSLAKFVTSAVGRCLSPLAKSIMPATRASIPPRQICHICRRQMSIPPRHLWRGGGRQAGGEVKQAGGEVKQAGGEVKRAGREVKQAGREVKQATV